jgi:hypothetical protein
MGRARSSRVTDRLTLLDEPAAPQIGIDVGRLRLAATYNAIVGATLELRQTIGDVEQTEKLSQSYMSLELSFRFGGGRKQRPAPMIAPPAPPAAPPAALPPPGPPGAPVYPAAPPM